MPSTSMAGRGTRRIWLCADDYGLAPGVNAAIRDLIARRRLNATSVMVFAPAFDASEAAALARLNADGFHAAIGLHVTLTAPFGPQVPGFRPLHDGAFLPVGALLKAALARRIDTTALTHEVDAQFTAFAAAFGRPPDFIDGHQHAHLFPQVRDVVLAAAERHAPGAFVRQCGRPGVSHLRPGDPKGLLLDLLSRAFRRRAAARRIATNPAFSGTYTFDPKADFATLFPGFLHGLPDGGLIMCHPGFVDETLRRLDALTDLREAEHAYLGGAAFPALLAREGVNLFGAGGDQLPIATPAP